MITVTIHLDSARGCAFDKLLGIGVIENVGGDPSRANYHVHLSKMAPKQREAWRTGMADMGDLTIDSIEVTGFDRVGRGVWDLLYIALRQIVGTRNPAPASIVPVVPGTSARIRQVKRR